MGEIKQLVILEYSTLFPGEDIPNVDDIIMSLSRNSIVNLVLVLTDLYSNASLECIDLFFHNKNSLSEIRRRIKKYCIPSINYIFLPLQTAIKILRKAMSLSPITEDNISQESELDFFKMILLINENEMKFCNASSVSRIIFMQELITYSSHASEDVYGVRSLLQLYMSYNFFMFLESMVESDDQLKDIYDHFLQQYGIKCGMDYILILFGVIALSKYKTGKLPKEVTSKLPLKYSQELIDALTIDLYGQTNEISTNRQRDNNIDYRNFRDKPFIKDKDGNYVVYWIEALIDRIYNSIYFDLLDIKRRFNIAYNKLPQLFTDQFVEKYFLHKLMKYANKENIYTAIYNTQDRENGKADYVLKHDKNIILFECKDVKISGEVIETHDAEQIIDEYKNKLFEETYIIRDGQKCYHREAKPKGIGQLVKYIKQVRNGDSYYEGMPDSIIYPVLILSDYKLLHRGFQQIADEWYEIGMANSKSQYDMPLIVMSFITLIKSYPLFSKYGFEKYFDDYRKYISSMTEHYKYITFDEYMQNDTEYMDISELRDEFHSAILINISPDEI